MLLAQVPGGAGEEGMGWESVRTASAVTPKYGSVKTSGVKQVNVQVNRCRCGCRFQEYSSQMCHFL